MGVVYVFNASSQPVRLSINNPARQGPAMQATSKNSRYPYTPFGVQIARSAVPSTPGAFINGQANSLTVQTQNGQSSPVTLDIPADPEGTTDLWLYVFANFMILFDTRGQSLDQEWIDWGGDEHTVPASAVGSKLIKRGPTQVTVGLSVRRGRAPKGGRR
jgi:hypothetical protein